MILQRHSFVVFDTGQYISLREIRFVFHNLCIKKEFDNTLMFIRF